MANSDQIGMIAKIASIMRVTSTDWLYSNNWWTMTPHVHSNIIHRQNSKDGELDNNHSFSEYVVRPVIKLLK